jgi:hypothetical protein
MFVITLRPHCLIVPLAVGQRVFCLTSYVWNNNATRKA